jgi:hypothetical protein
MTMFPPDWEMAPSIDRLPETCPYTQAEIEDYLRRCHLHLLTSEEPAIFRVSGPLAERGDAARRFWVFEASDNVKQRQWYVLIGTGTSFSDPSQKMRRWMFAKTSGIGLSPTEFLEDEYREQCEADARKR